MCNAKPPASSVILAALLPMILVAQGPPPGRGPDGKIKVSPETVYFTLSGNQATQTRTVQVKRTGPPGPALSLTTAISAVSGGSWLNVSLAGSNLTLTASRGTLQPGLYESKVTITPAGQPPITLSVFLRIVGGPAGPGGPAGLLVRPTSLSFRMTQGGGNPEPKNLTVSPQGGVAAPAWSASRSIATPAGGNWFQIAANVAGGLINVTVNGAGLAVGRYSGSISVTSGSQTVQVPVTLDVNAQGGAQGQDSRLLVIHPRAFNFIRHPGSPPPGPKTLNIKTTRQTQQNWSAASTVNWLSVSPANGQTPGMVQLSLVAANLPASGHHEGMVRVTSGNVTETARVFYRVVGAGGPGGPGPSGQAPVPGATPSAVQITPRSIEFSSTGGVVTPASVPVQISSGTPGLSFAASRSTASGGSWLNISANSGSVPGGLNVTANAAGLGPGVYTGLVTINITGAVSEQRLIQVTLRVSAAGGPVETPRLALSRGAVTFQTTVGGPNPTSQQVSLEARGAASIPFQAVVSTANNVNWLAVSPNTGIATANITVSVNIAGLGAGVHNAVVFFQATGATPALSAVLNVVLTIAAGPGASAARLASAQAGLHGVFVEPAQDFVSFTNSPTPVTVRLFHSDGTPANGAVVQLASTGDEAAFQLDELGGGLYTGTFLGLSGGPVSLTASATTASGEAILIGVGGDIEGSADPPPVIFQEGIVSTASFAPGATPVAPGAILSLFGKDLAEASAVASGFPLPRTLSGAKVLVGGWEAPLISVTVDAGDGFDQINFQLPVEAAAFTFADVVVLSDGGFSHAEGLSIASSLPALFTLSQRGTGAAAALRADFSLVSAANPARPGETILLYATGLGETTPEFRSGQPPATLSRVIAGVDVRVGGVPARVSFAGMAPLFAGLYQINFEVPAGVPPGQATLDLIAGGIGAGEGVTLDIGR